MKLSIVIPTHNRKYNILKVLKCLERQDTQDFEVVVVDDGSDDRTTEAIIQNIKLPKLKLLYKGYRDLDWSASIPRNLGAKISKGELILFLDSDVLLPPDRIRRFLDIWGADADENRVLVGPYHYLRNEIDIEDESWYNRELKDYIEDTRWNPTFKDRDPMLKTSGVGEALGCFGGSLLIPRKLFFKTGGYDEFVTSGCEDGEFGLTLWESGAVFSFDKGLLGWHHPHEITAARTSHIPEMIKYIDEKHNMDTVKETGKIMRANGIDWEPPESWKEETK